MKLTNGWPKRALDVEAGAAGARVLADQLRVGARGEEGHDQGEPEGDPDRAAGLQRHLPDQRVDAAAEDVADDEQEQQLRRDHPPQAGVLARGVNAAGRCSVGGNRTPSLGAAARSHGNGHTPLGEIQHDEKRGPPKRAPFQKGAVDGRLAQLSGRADRGDAECSSGRCPAGAVATADLDHGGARLAVGGLSTPGKGEQSAEDDRAAVDAA